MSYKLIGAMLVLIAGGGVGYKMSKLYILQEKQLEQLIWALEYMKCELQYRLTSLSTQFKQCGSATNGAISCFFFALADELDSQINPNAEYCLNAILGKAKDLTPAVAKVFAHMGKTLGNFDLQGQLSCFDDTIIYAKNILVHYQNRHTAKTRNYQTLGLCAGAALIILLM